MSKRAPYETLAADGMRAVGSVYNYVAHCGLEKSLVDLAYLRASQINGCAYCIDAHVRDLRKDGAPVEKLALVGAWRETGLMFSDRERAALAWTEALTLVSERRAPDDVYAELKAQFTDEEQVQLTLLINVINGWNRLGVGFAGPVRSAAEIRAA